MLTTVSSRLASRRTTRDLGASAAGLACVEIPRVARMWVRHEYVKLLGARKPRAYPSGMSTFRHCLLVLAICMLASCKARKSTPEPPQQPEAELPSRLPAPAGTSREVAVGDEVSILEDDGRFEIDGRVTAVTQSPKRYTVRIGSGRLASTKSVGPSQIFPPPWASAARVRVGDTIYERRTGNFVPPKCVVKEVPADVRESITALCDGATKTLYVARRDTFYAFEPATLSSLSVGDIVYYDQMWWVMIVGTSQGDGRVAIRETGFNKKDRLVSLSKIQRVR